ncbi:hypothetical protein P775_15465 [Puniceibacterium antarcticum]|uniref:GAF domain-containing protein n=1 Tax=Puniceibacterium antarcticum TaxID=1206336 RepID=A0A2G8RCI5_9RHOB|nr:GAF domain-containing protein [Puniceibacterium antarcticum]PIL19284.1 hypothetical protein P775_15465 [Puniceibacterium antarcticum]
MDTLMETPVRTFVDVMEIWVPEGDRLVPGGGHYGTLSAFAEASRKTSFARGEGLPGKAWAEERPIVLKAFEGSYFLRTDAAKEAGLTSAVAIPVFAGRTLKAVLVVLCSDDADRYGAIEVWAESDGILSLQDGYYGAAKQFEEISQRTTFKRGQGLPGSVWSSKTPILMRDLGLGYGFMRAESAGKIGLNTGLGLPVPVPNGTTYALTLLTASGTPIARRFEIWDARTAKVGSSGKAVLSDGICARSGPLWNFETDRMVAPWQGPVGRALASGLPVIDTGAGAAGYASMVALPIHRGAELAHIVAWYC